MLPVTIIAFIDLMFMKFFLWNSFNRCKDAGIIIIPLTMVFPNTENNFRLRIIVDIDDV